MAETAIPGEGTLVKVQVRRAGVMILQETYFVSQAGDLKKATASALSVATRRHPDLPPADLLARVDPVSWPGARPGPAEASTRTTSAMTAGG